VTSVLSIEILCRHDIEVDQIVVRHDIDVDQLISRRDIEMVVLIALVLGSNVSLVLVLSQVFGLALIWRSSHNR